MDKFIGFDIDNKKTIACVIQQGQGAERVVFKGKSATYLSLGGPIHVRFSAARACRSSISAQMSFCTLRE